MTGEPIRPEPTLSLARLSKEPVMPDVPDHNDPASSAVKPGASSSEGRIALLVVLVTTLGPVITAIAGAMPDDPRVQIAVAVLACLTSVLTALGYLKKRSDVKETANQVAGGLAHRETAAATALALADKAIAIAKDHPELARDLLKSAGIGPGSDPGNPTTPASS